MTDGNETIEKNQQIIGLAPDQPPYRIMIVDDKETNRQFMLKLLGPLGFQMQEAENGAEAVEIAQQFKPHLIWMDIRMPVLDGIEATKRLKAMPLGQTLKIIALTASAYEEERADIIAAGCNDFVRKPIQVDTVFELLSKHIGVRYVYVDVAPQPVIRHQHVPLQDEVKAALDTIPTALIVRLRECLELGNTRDIDQTIAEIGEYHAVLAQSLQRLAQDFQFDELLALLEGKTDS